jgi:predicted Ser/Thr protein kinase
MSLLNKNTVVSHGDLDQKNVLWDKTGKPILIDWESACKINHSDLMSLFSIRTVSESTTDSCKIWFLYCATIASAFPN